MFSFSHIIYGWIALKIQIFHFFSGFIYRFHNNINNSSSRRINILVYCNWMFIGCYCWCSVFSIFYNIYNSVKINKISTFSVRNEVNKRNRKKYYKTNQRLCSTKEKSAKYTFLGVFPFIYCLQKRKKSFISVLYLSFFLPTSLILPLIAMKFGTIIDYLSQYWTDSDKGGNN